MQHGLQSSANAGRLRLAVRVAGKWLEMSVSDDGQGVPSTEIERARGAPEGPRTSAVAPAVANIVWALVSFGSA